MICDSECTKVDYSPKTAHFCKAADVITFALFQVTNHIG